MNRNKPFLRPAFFGPDGQLPVTTLAGIRLIFAALLLIGTLGDHEDPGFGWRLKFDDVFATVYLIPAVVAMILAICDPFRDFRFFPVALTFDIASLIVLMTTIERPESGFLGLIVCGITIVLLEVAFRWNIKVARLVARLFAVATLFQFVNRRSIGTPYRRAKGTPLQLRGLVDAGRVFRAAGGVGRA
ncbi:MAG: hypothetical protein IPG83_11035 [Novosphingobium sp.]|nr:hypothetical protein [Novosphingobium sp.]